MIPTPRTKIKRIPQRACYEQEKVYSIIDAAMVCHIAFSTENNVNIIPTIHWRMNDHLYIHGSSKSRLIEAVQRNPVCIGITLLDGLVLARSAFHHSMNYRSVVIYSQGTLIANEEEKQNISQYFMDKVMPGRWDDIRQPNSQELKATAFVAFPLDEASAKIRTGGPVDDPEDLELSMWAGHIPFEFKPLSPIPAEGIHQKLPAY